MSPLANVLRIKSGFLVNIMKGISGGSIDTALNSLPSTLPSSGAIAHIPPPPNIPLHASVRAMMTSIEHTSTSMLPYVAARLEWITPTWRKHYVYLSTFFDDKIAEASDMKQGEDTGLATDTDCVIDMAVQRREREGMGKMEREEFVDELMIYIMQVTHSPLFQFLY